MQTRGLVGWRVMIRNVFFFSQLSFRRSFFILIISVALLTLVEIALVVVVVIEEAAFSSVEPRWISVRGGGDVSCIYCLYFQRVGGFSPIALYTTVSILVIINIPLFVLDLQLVCLHIYLSYCQLTTYEYITRRVLEPVRIAWWLFNQFSFTHILALLQSGSKRRSIYEVLLWLDYHWWTVRSFVCRPFLLSVS